MQFSVSDDLGCSVNALTFLDKVCSGKVSCEYLVAGEDLYATQPCPGHVATFLEIGYDCVKGQMKTSLNNSATFYSK